MVTMKTGRGFFIMFSAFTFLVGVPFLVRMVTWLNGVGPRLSWHDVVLLTLTTGFGLAARQGWLHRLDEFSAEVSSDGVRWWEHGTERFVPFSDVERVVLEINDMPTVLRIYRRSGEAITPNEGFPDAGALFRAVRRHFGGPMFSGRDEVPADSRSVLG